MSLNPEVEAYVNELLYVEPFYGWGWSRLDPGAPKFTQEQAAGPPPFHIRVERFYTHRNELRNELRGAICILEEPGHPYDGLYVVCYTHYDNLLNFTDSIGFHHILIGPHQPVRLEADDLEEPDWPHWQMTGSPYVNGYAVIGEAEPFIRAYYKRVGME